MRKVKSCQWELGLAWGYVGPIYDAQEAKVQKVKDKQIKERERRKEQSGKWVPHQPVVTLTGLQSETQLNGEEGSDKIRIR